MNVKLINLNNRSGAKFITFPDGQPHVNIGRIDTEPVDVICSLDSPQKLLELLMVSNALTEHRCVKRTLVIPYLMGARFDRIMEHGDSFDLKVISNLINQCGFSRVKLFDPHSDVSPALIDNVIVVSNKHLVQAYDIEESVLICPDAGAAKKVGNYFEWNSHLKDIVYCVKHRDLSNGAITLKVLEPEKCKGRNCVIIDDLCDAGGTFLGIASQIEPKNLVLIVSHGIFSKGFELLNSKFREIITTDSYKYWSKSDSQNLIVLPSHDI